MANEPITMNSQDCRSKSVTSFDVPLKSLAELRGWALTGYNSTLPFIDDRRPRFVLV